MTLRTDVISCQTGREVIDMDRRASNKRRITDSLGKSESLAIVPSYNRSLDFSTWLQIFSAAEYPIPGRGL